jgi:phosphatidylserine/phosphatidylglycerophosphate/cardiolipin synthase-like enzyme
MRSRLCVIIGALIFVAVAAPEAEAEYFCDSSRQNCRTPLLNLIAAEGQAIDVGFWFMEDARYTTALAEARQRGVRIRVLVDTKANTNYPQNANMLSRLQQAGMPMRRITSSWLHWKMMLFHGQNVVQFGGANYSPHAFVPASAGVDFLDETILFSDDPAIVNSFRRKFDDAWVSSRFTNYANITGTPTRAYPLHAVSTALNFPPSEDFGARSVNRYAAENAGIDVIMFRLGDRRHADAIIAARRRGVPVRLYTEQGQYRAPNRPLHSFDVDRLHMAGVIIRHRNHDGWNHQKVTLLHGQRLAIFGSQNWTHTSGQYEHNYFTTKPALYDWLSALFVRKWTNETLAFTPLGPNAPVNRAPGSGVSIASSTTQATLRWYAGLWAHKYDIYFGTSSNPPRIATDVQLGYSGSTSDLKSYTVTGLQPNRTYYWKVVSKTMANQTRTGAVTSFTTGS